MELSLQASLGAPPLCGGLPSYSNSFPLMMTPHRSCADCNRMSAYLSAAVSGSGCESVVSRVSLPACQTAPFPPALPGPLQAVSGGRYNLGGAKRQAR